MAGAGYVKCLIVCPGFAFMKRGMNERIVFHTEWAKGRSAMTAQTAKEQAETKDLSGAARRALAMVAMLAPTSAMAHDLPGVPYHLHMEKAATALVDLLFAVAGRPVLLAGAVGFGGLLFGLNALRRRRRAASAVPGEPMALPVRVRR